MNKENENMKSIEETLDMLYEDWIIEPQNEVKPQNKQSKGNQLKNPVWIYPNISKEENEKRIENILDAWASVIVHNINNGFYEKDDEKSNGGLVEGSVIDD